MEVVDKSSAPVQLLRAWSSFGLRFAVLVGALTALVSLLGHVPVWVASLRGAGAWFALVLLTKGGTWLLPRTHTAPTFDEEPEAPIEDAA